MATRWSSLVSSSRLLDAIVVALTVGFTLAAVATSEPFEPTPLNLGVIAAACLSLVWRRRNPWPVFALAMLALLATGTPALPMLATATVAEQYGSRGQTWVAGAVGTLVVAAGEVRELDTQRAWLIWGVVICLPTAVGLYLNSRETSLAAAVLRADRLTAAQATLAEAARREERARIAREMHDVVAHQVSLIAVQAGALEVAAQGTPVEQSATLIRTTARQALEELRQVIGILRSAGEGEGEARAPQPSLATIAEMIERWRAAGTDVSLVDRTPDGHLDGLPGTVGRTAYRVVEEALTNVSKHAPGSRVEVVLTADEPGLGLEVRNSVGTRQSSRADTGAGTGLYGLRERTELVGGRFEAGPDGTGGFRVRVTLPLRSADR